MADTATDTAAMPFTSPSAGAASAGCGDPADAPATVQPRRHCNRKGEPGHKARGPSKDKWEKVEKVQASVALKFSMGLDTLTPEQWAQRIADGDELASAVQSLINKRAAAHHTSDRPRTPNVPPAMLRPQIVRVDSAAGSDSDAA